MLPVFKTTFSKSKPKEIVYGSFKKSNEEDFNQELRGNLSLIKKKILRANQAPYVTKTLRKAIMKRSQLEKIYFNKRTQESFKIYKKKTITAVDYTNESEKVFLKA